jgi:Zn-dependent M28 family amino/carboxypeptidase
MEEFGLVGSQRFVQSSRDIHIVAMLNVDMVGYGDTVIFGPSVGGDENASQILPSCCAQLSIDCFSSPRLPPGDQDSFRRMNIPALSLTILPSLEAHQAWLLMNGARDSGLREDFEPAIAQVIHTERDTFERLDPSAMTTAYEVLRTVLLTLDAAVR